LFNFRHDLDFEAPNRLHPAKHAVFTLVQDKIELSIDAYFDEYERVGGIL